MASGSRTYTRSIEAEVSSATNLYNFIGHLEVTLKKYVPDVQSTASRVLLPGVGVVQGSDPLKELSDEEMHIAPSSLYIAYDAQWYHFAIFGNPGYSKYPEKTTSVQLKIEGSEEIRVIGLYEKLRTDIARLIEQIEANEGVGSIEADRPAPTPTPPAGQQIPKGADPEIAPASEVTPALVPVGPPLSAGGSQLVTLNQPSSRLSRVAGNSWVIGIGTGLVVWLVTNLTSATSAISSWWTIIARQPWAGQVSSFALSVLAGVVSALIVNALHRRPKK
jgi:hypothetical protein